MALVFNTNNSKFKVILVGFATFFFGFGAGAIFNFYLIYIHSPILSTLRTSLTFISSILGDGILLPIVNMAAASFLIKNSKYKSRFLLYSAMASGGVITAWFHISQAVRGLVNWSMPTPWHWNVLGLWHGIYMYSVTSFISFFYFTIFKVIRKEKRVPLQFLLITAGLVLFFILLDYDYR